MQLLESLRQQYQSNMTMRDPSRFHYQLESSFNVTTEWKRSLVVLRLGLWGTVIVIIWWTVNKVSKHGSHCLIHLENRLSKKREDVRDNVLERNALNKLQKLFTCHYQSKPYKTSKHCTLKTLQDIKGILHVHFCLFVITR